MLFGSAADSLEKSVEQEDEYMIIEKAPMVNTFISSAPCNCAAFVAGIVRGVLDGSQFPATVSAHEHEGRNVLLIKFAPELTKAARKTIAMPSLSFVALQQYVSAVAIIVVPCRYREVACSISPRQSGDLENMTLLERCMLPHECSFSGRKSLCGVPSFNGAIHGALCTRALRHTLLIF
eukprot:6176261-Pleurochrysis_carterae.AAC.1